jgi:hypothetical protein
MPSDTIQASSLDSIKKLIPAGFFVLSERGARKSLKAAVDAKAYFEKWQLTDEQLGIKAVMLSVVSMERNQAIDLNLTKDATIAALSRRLRWAKVWQYSALAGCAILGTKLILRPP